MIRSYSLPLQFDLLLKDFLQVVYHLFDKTVFICFFFFFFFFFFILFDM